MTYDALVVVSFGGPEGPADVIPFLENVLRGRPVSPERFEQVAAHYQRFGGISPINGLNRALVAALDDELRSHDMALPVYWGNRNWHPYLADTVRQMADDGVTRALAFVTSAYSSYSGCRQYLDDISRARAEVGPRAPVIDKLRVFFDHPGFIEANAGALRVAVAAAGPGATVLFTAHSVPVAMAETSDYVAQLRATATLVADRGAPGHPWQLAWQSRSGSPAQPWLEPDVAEVLRRLASEGVSAVVAAPIGFVADHMEVVYDLDIEAAEVARRLGLVWVRAATAGTSPPFVTMVRQLVTERLDRSCPRLALAGLGPRPDSCAADCCPPPPRPGSRPSGG